MADTEMSQYLQLFLDEASEGLDLLERDALRLEDEHDSNVHETLQEMLRAAHTLKGCSRAMGFTEFANLTHRMEDLLDTTARCNLDLSPDLIELLFRCLDALASMKADIERGSGNGADTANLIQALDSLLDTQPRADPASLDLAAARGSWPCQNGEHPQAIKPEQRQTIRVDSTVLDNLLNLAGELVIGKTKAAQLASSFSAQHPEEELTGDLEETAARLGRISRDLHHEIMRARMLPAANAFNRLPRLVRDLASRDGKEVDLQLAGQETGLDRSLIEAITDPLIHLVTNSVDHGIELPDEREAAGKPRRATVKVAASTRQNHVRMVVSDDGRGVDLDGLRERAVATGIISAEQAEGLSDRSAVELVFAAGLSTSEQVTDVSGRGVGMDVVRSDIEQVGGQIVIETRPGEGTKVTIRLPLTLAIIQALLVRAGGAIYAFPLAFVDENLYLEAHRLCTGGSRASILHRGENLPVAFLDKTLFRDIAPPQTYNQAAKRGIVVVSVGGQRIGLVVDRLLRQEEIVVQPLGDFLGRISGISGATILADGTVALILDVPGIVAQVTESLDRQTAA